EGKVFTGEIARLGKWNGKASEGFVGRTHFSVPPTSRGKPARSRPTPGVVVFLKVKFEQPYLTYRDW
ncbi:hypothetical protein DICSQDRAFT_24163, partial [Dichomitus squalens LYAD-421 SS1]